MPQHPNTNGIPLLLSPAHSIRMETALSPKSHPLLRQLLLPAPTLPSPLCFSGHLIYYPGGFPGFPLSCCAGSAPRAGGCHRGAPSTPSLLVLGHPPAPRILLLLIPGMSSPRQEGPFWAKTRRAALLLIIHIHRDRSARGNAKAPPRADGDPNPGEAASTAKSLPHATNALM